MTTAAPSAASTKANGVAAVERALALVAAIERADGAVALSELAAMTGFYKSTILRLLTSLLRAGYVVRLSDGRYDLGATAFRLGASFERKSAIRHHVLPALQQLVDSGSESASFHIRLDDDNRLCLFRVNSRHSTLDRVEPGATYPLAQGAAGHVILAFAGKTGARYDAIRSDLNSVSLGERDANCAAVAAPVFGPRNALIGVLSLSGPRERFGAAEIAGMTAMLHPVARQLTERLGGEWPRAA